MSKTDNRPSHRVYAVTKNGERSFWQPIGAAWVHSDGWGFNVKIDYLRFMCGLPCLELSSPPQFAEALPAKGRAVDDDNVRLCHGMLPLRPRRPERRRLPAMKASASRSGNPWRAGRGMR
jgi:hypothetical protein